MFSSTVTRVKQQKNMKQGLKNRKTKCRLCNFTYLQNCLITLQRNRETSHAFKWRQTRLNSWTRLKGQWLWAWECRCFLGRWVWWKCGKFWKSVMLADVAINFKIQEFIVIHKQCVTLCNEILTLSLTHTLGTQTESIEYTRFFEMTNL